MAILTEDNGNEYEVIIKRYPEETTYEEYVMIVDRE